MTLPASGNPISMSQMRTEYTELQSQSQVRLSDFYYGASKTKSYLPKNSCTDAVRATASDATKHPGFTPHLEGIPEVSSPVGSAPIKLSQFYSKSYYFAPQDDSSISGTNVIFDPKVEEDNALKTNAINSTFIDVNVSSECNSDNTSKAGVTISTKQRSHTTVWLNIPSNQRIIGKGGKGGDANGNAGSDGGNAITSNIHIFLNSQGRTYGGGGGGGASGCNSRTFQECYCCGSSSGSVGGCGGGGGAGGGAGGAGGGADCGGNFATSGFSGTAGGSANDSTGGAGGSGSRYLDSTVDGVSININANAGSGGGGWGAAGGGGGSNGNGGAAGKALYVKSGMYRKILTTGQGVAGTTNESF